MSTPHLKLFESLNAKKVEYLLIGGTLAIAYGVPRTTKDIDIFLRPTLDNAKLLLQALENFGMGTSTLVTPDEICKTEVTIFKDFIRLDVLTQVKGIHFDECIKNKFDLQVGSLSVPSLNLDDLIKSKKAAGRTSDLEDIRILESIQSKKINKN